MTEATHTAEQMYALPPATGRNTGRLYAGYLQIDHDETIDTGMHFVHALVACPVEDLATDTPFANPQIVSATGAIIMTVSAWDDGTSDAASNHYVIAVGEN